MSWNNYKYLYQKYVTEEMSWGAIAKLHDTHANTIRRAALKLGIESRTKNDAQRSYLEKNDHPMLGVERSENEKKKISEGLQNYWDCLDEEEAESLRNELSERAKGRWDWMTKEEKVDLINGMNRANREKSGQGSKNENRVRELLIDAGYKAMERTNDYSPRRQFEIDIPIPAESVAIEWDGAAHFEPIYGEDSLQKTLAKDERKNKALTGHGWSVIRVRDHSTSHSTAFCRRAVNQIIEVIKDNDGKKVYYIDAE